MSTNVEYDRLAQELRNFALGALALIVPQPMFMDPCNDHVNWLLLQTIGRNRNADERCFWDGHARAKQFHIFLKDSKWWGTAKSDFKNPMDPDMQ